MLGEGDRGSARLAGREWGRVWAQIVDVGFAPTGTWQLALPPGAKLSNVKHQLQHKLVVNRGVGRRQGIFVAASTSWHQLPFTGLEWMVNTMYEEVDMVPAHVEAERLASIEQRATWV